MAHKQLRTFHLFAGAGGGILGDLLLGHLPVGACEIEPYPRNVLLARQRDGHLPEFPIWDDVCTLDGIPWRGSVDVLCGGFPCQDISAAGKGAGITGERSGLWKEYARLIGEMRPRFVFAENSPLLRTRGLGVVLEDLAALGYNARWGIIGARDVGAPHKRDRMWVLAYQCGLAHTNRGDDKCGQGERPRIRTTQTGQGTDYNPSRSSKRFKDVAYAECEGSLRGREQYKPSVLAEDGRQVQGEGHKQTVSFEGCGKLRADEDMAYANDKRTQVSTQGRLATEQEPWGVGEIRGDWWHTDPAEIPYTGNNGNEQRFGKLQKSEPVTRERSDRRGNPQEHESGEWRSTEPIVGRVANGVANRVDRLKAIGNGQVPQCAALAWDLLSEGLI